MPDQKSITIKVNGTAVELNAFAQSIIGNAIEAMVLSLRLNEQPDRIEITINK